VELVNLEAEQLSMAELLKSLHDLGAGGDELARAVMSVPLLSFAATTTTTFASFISALVLSIANA
jgi:hypothetical protein